MRYLKTIQLIRTIYGNHGVIPLHAPVFSEKEKQYIEQCLDSTYVSTVGNYVSRFEKLISSYTGVKFAVATVNGTSALHTALKVVGVKQDSEVITQPLTFVATCNAIAYCGAYPVFVDIEKNTLGMDPESLESFLSSNTTLKNNYVINKATGRRIKAVVPVHIFGHQCRISEMITEKMAK